MSKIDGVNQDLLTQFEEFKLLVESLETELVKNASGNKSAGVRVRKGLREAKKIASTIVKTSLESDKG
jgi:hypothetical protein